MRICAGFGILLLAGSYLGAVHPLGDSLAVFRVWIAGGVVGLGLVTLVARLWLLGPISVVLGVAALANTVEVAITAVAGPDLTVTVYSKNLGAGRVDWARLADDIGMTRADIVVLQEVTQQTMGQLPALLPDHPYQHICNFSGWSAMAVASRWPLSEPGCTDHRSLAYALVDAPDGPIWVASIHQVWPFPYPQAELLPDILAAVEAAPARQIIAGDFNMVPWGNSVRQIQQAGGTRRLNVAETTIEVRGVGLSIDHVLSDGFGQAGRRPRFGSDHYGMVARIGW